MRAAEGEAQVKRGFRLTRSTDIKRVRRSGKSYAHPLMVLYVLRSDLPGLHIAVSAGLGVGNAVKRNRARRLLRAAMSDLLPLTTPGRCPEPVEGSDLLLIARAPLPAVKVQETREALSILLKRAGLLPQAYEFRNPAA